MKMCVSRPSAVLWLLSVRTESNPPEGASLVLFLFRTAIIKTGSLEQGDISHSGARYFLYGQKVPKEPLGVGTGYFIPLPAHPQTPVNGLRRWVGITLSNR